MISPTKLPWPRTSSTLHLTEATTGGLSVMTLFLTAGGSLVEAAALGALLAVVVDFFVLAWVLACLVLLLAGTELVEAGMGAGSVTAGAGADAAAAGGGATTGGSVLLGVCARIDAA